ncbi:LADA_0E06216g1_1 [Lachancea dasiensis]|uniref:COP9 signalosome complex subunit 5 n=1 Tax=Lachancea dasiensis TaxID=1072105 RepID=A0A1G4JCQ5_9SACH|nr:LADA_0E06216g1_1 [Lachancea dasiensis]
MRYKDQTSRALRAQVDQCISSIKDDESIGDSPAVLHGGENQVGQRLLSITQLCRNPNSKTFNSELWKTDPRYLKNVFLSNQASYKILQHAVRGGDVEIMGMLIGRVHTTSIMVLDCYALPVEGTETRVNAQSESYEYMVQYMNEIYGTNQANLHIVGWYHSHPGYGCWLSGIDVQTQELNQTFQDPYVALVVDPTKSLREKRLSIGAFRTIPDEALSEPPQEAGNGDAKNYGLHHLKYYELEVDICASRFDKALTISQLNLEVPVLDESQDSILVEQLLECIKNWHNYSKLSASSQFILEAPLQSTIHRNENDIDMEDSSYFRSVPTSVNSSLTSMAEDNARSDVDMGSNTLSRQESTESSLPRNSSNQLISIPNASQQKANLMLEYQLHRKKMTASKLRQYQRLRFSRDAFTL